MVSLDLGTNSLSRDPHSLNRNSAAAELLKRIARCEASGRVAMSLSRPEGAEEFSAAPSVRSRLFGCDQTFHVWLLSSGGFAARLKETGGN
jgi:hypothetical protein